MGQRTSATDGQRTGRNRNATFCTCRACRQIAGRKCRSCSDVAFTVESNPASRTSRNAVGVVQLTAASNA